MISKTKKTTASPKVPCFVDMGIIPSKGRGRDGGGIGIIIGGGGGRGCTGAG